MAQIDRYQILEQTPFSKEYHPTEPYRPLDEWQIQTAEYELKLNAKHYYEWAIKIDDRFFYQRDIAECILAYWRTRWPWAKYKLAREQQP